MRFFHKFILFTCFFTIFGAKAMTDAEKAKIIGLKQAISKHNVALKCQDNIKNDHYKKKNISFTDALLTSTNGVNNKKHSFVSEWLDFKVLNADISIRPYFGFGYAFNAANYSNDTYTQKITNLSYQANGNPGTSFNNVNGVTSSGSVLPSMFHQFGGILGFIINDKFVIEFGGQSSLFKMSNGISWINFYPANNVNAAGYDSYTSTSSSELNTLRFTLGYILDEELFGKYGDKNKLILLFGLVVGIYNTTTIDNMNGYYVASNNAFYQNGARYTESYQTIVTSPEFGLAYQRYITDHLSLRLDGRMNMLGVNGMGAINGTLMASVLFHI